MFRIGQKIGQKLDKLNIRIVGHSDMWFENIIKLWYDHLLMCDIVCYNIRIERNPSTIW